MPVKTVDAQTLKLWMSSGEALVIDVREPAEHSFQRIEGTQLIPLDTVCKGSLPCAEGKKLVFHCRSGKRSSSACEKLMKEDSSLEIYNLEGGILAWQGSGNAVILAKKFFLPLDQQVQLTTGLLLFLGSISGYLFSPAWFFLTGFIGAGLILAGLTGFCGLARIIARMPWNQGAKTSSCALSKA